MTLKDRVQSELKQLASPPTTSPTTLLCDEGGARLIMELTQVGPVGCSFERLSLATAKLNQASIQELKSIAEDLEQRLSYLLESIRPIEIDEDACVIQMRSNPPAQDDDGTKYYELVVDRSGIGLRRFCKVRGEPRVPVPAEVTHEVAVRLVSDFSDVS